MKSNNLEKSYPVKNLNQPTKRICLTLDLKNDPELIKEYIHYHSPDGYWMEITKGIQEAGVSVMDIYQLDNRLFMICEVPIDKDFDIIWNSMGNFPRQKEWAQLMKKFQQELPGHAFGWVKMERIYTLY